MCVVVHVVSVIFCHITDGKLAHASSDGRAYAANTKRDNICALDTIGVDSVFIFFLTDKWWGLDIALVTMGVQIWIFFMFVDGSEHIFPIPEGTKPD